MAIEKPVAEDTTLAETALLKECQGYRIVVRYDGIELVQVQHGGSIVHHSSNGRTTITLAALGIENDDAYLGPLVLGTEIDDIGDAHRLTIRCLDYQPYLFVGIGIIGRRGDIVVKGIAGIGHVGSPYIPQATVVLYLIEQIEVFGFNGTQPY